ncbi:MAG: winged helix DNA-binding domain-containing protein [Acidimicrobiia bacterium]
MTSEHLRRAWARAQLLDGRGRSGVAEVAGVVGGLQAQDFTAAALSIRARGGAGTYAEVEAAVTSGDVAVAWTLRGTRHLHPRADLAWLVRLLGPMFNRPGSARARQLGLDGRTGDRAVAAVREALADGPLDRAQVKGLLAPLGVDPSGQAPVHVLARAAREGALYVLPGRPERYARLDPDDGSGPPDPAAELARRHLAAFGPAAPEDFRAWSGMGAGAARNAWAAIEGELAGVGDGRWVLAQRLDRVRADTRRPAPARLLGAFDTLLLGRADRATLLPPEHARRVNAGGGMVKPTVVVDGAVVGTWAVRKGQVEVAPFAEIAADLGPEVAAVEAFLDP